VVLGVSIAVFASTRVSASHDSALRDYAGRAEAGNLGVQKTFAFLLLEGGVMGADPGAAVRWLSRVAARGDTDAQVALADVYREGRGVEPDRRLAMQWYRMAVPESPYAAWRLGQLLETGEGGEPDSEESLRLYLHAAEAGLAGAQNSLGNLFVAGIDVPQDYAEAREWYQKAAQGGDPEALLNLAGMYYLGLGVEQNYDQAVELARAAALHHARDAAAFLVEMERGRDKRKRLSQ
jgi:TPR repeat protein